MWKINLKVLGVTVVVMAFYTMVANVIPQLQSEVPAALDLSAGATPEALVAAGDRIYNGAGACDFGACAREASTPRVRLPYLVASSTNRGSTALTLSSRGSPP